MHSFAFIEPGWGKILVVLLVALVLFGAKKLPEIGRGLGKGIREFKSGVQGLDDDKDDAAKPPAAEAKDPAKDKSDG